jgi:hypothetical protein
MTLPPLQPGYPHNFPEGLLARTHSLEESLHSRELAWEYPDILEVVTAVTDAGCIILGGEVMEATDPSNDPIKDPSKDPSSVEFVGNWAPKFPNGWDVFATSHPEWGTYVQESRRVSVEYIEFVHERNRDKLGYYTITCQLPDQD